VSEKTLVAKMAEVMAEVGYVQKDSRNDFHKYRYASAEAVLKKVNAALSERGIAMSSGANLEHYDNGHAVVKLALTFHDGNDSLTVEGLGEGSDKGDKSVMKANTAALKYAMANAFLISWGDDPEADVNTDRAAQAEDIDPTTGEALEDYPTLDALIGKMHGKRGVRELRQLAAHAMAAGWDEAALYTWAEKQGVDLTNGANYSDYVKLRDAIKAERKAGVK